MTTFMTLSVVFIIIASVVMRNWRTKKWARVVGFHCAVIAFGFVAAIYSQFIIDNQQAAGWSCAAVALGVLGAFHAYRAHKNMP